MPTIKYVDHEVSESSIDVPVGNSVMQGAVEHFIEGIPAECGGACACATCHIYVDDAWLEKAGEPAADEMAMLQMVIDPAPNSRLGCQLTVTDEMGGMIVKIPESQA